MATNPVTEILKKILTGIFFFAACGCNEPSSLKCDSLYKAGNYRSALYCYNKIAGKGNKDLQLHVYRQRSYCYYYLANYTAALADIKIANKMKPTSNTYVFQGGLARRTGNDRLANMSYSLALEINPNHLEALQAMGMMSLDWRGTADAANYFERALAIDSNNCTTLNGYSIVWKEMKLYDAAIYYNSKAIANCPESDVGYFNRAICLCQKKDYRNALKDLNIADSLSPSSDTTLFNRGMVYLWLGEIDSACIDWRKAEALGNHDAKQAIEHYCKKRGIY